MEHIVFEYVKEEKLEIIEYLQISCCKSCTSMTDSRVPYLVKDTVESFWLCLSLTLIYDYQLWLSGTVTSIPHNQY